MTINRSITATRTVPADVDQDLPLEGSEGWWRRSLKDYAQRFRVKVKVHLQGAKCRNAPWDEALYPLLNIDITMENHHVSWEISLGMAIINSYVSHYQRVRIVTSRRLKSDGEWMARKTVLRPKF